LLRKFITKSRHKISMNRLYNHLTLKSNNYVMLTLYILPKGFSLTTKFLLIGNLYNFLKIYDVLNWDLKDSRINHIDQQKLLCLSIIKPITYGIIWPVFWIYVGGRYLFTPRKLRTLNLPVPVGYKPCTYNHNLNGIIPHIIPNYNELCQCLN
jgi:hypothetical protein